MDISPVVRLVKFVIFRILTSRSIDLNYQDPRAEVVQKAEEAHRDSLREDRERLEREWEEEKRLATEAGEPEPSKPKPLLLAEQREASHSIGNEEGGAVQPDWGDSPIEVGIAIWATYTALIRLAFTGDLVARSPASEGL